MDALFKVDWAQVFIPNTPVLEIIVRGVITYVALFLLLRFVLKREEGTIGITDLLVVVLIADAAQNAMAADYKSITDGIILVATIIFCSYFFDWLGYHFPFIQRILRPPPLCLIKDGKPLRRNMRRELISREELESLLREQGVNDISQVKKAFMEGDGKISVITKDAEQHQPPEKETA